jgi:hypothetical protein
LPQAFQNASVTRQQAPLSALVRTPAAKNSWFYYEYGDAYSEKVKKRHVIGKALQTNPGRHFLLKRAWPK